MHKRVVKRVLAAAGILACLGLAYTGVIILRNEIGIIPVEGAGRSSWNPGSYWAYPWGKSITHKGIDIFAKKGTTVKASHGGIVVSTGNGRVSGKYAVLLDENLRYYYYAHLNSIAVKQFQFISQGQKIGSVGDTGNARGKPPHLHFVVITSIPHFWLADKSVQGRRKMFFLDPGTLIK